MKLGAPASDLDTVRRFYADLGVEAPLEFAAAEGRPFYHFALLVPGDRFEAANAWIRDRVELLETPGSPGPVMDFPAWDAQAVYFHDPAGSVVELIAHRGLAESGRSGPFSGGELAGVSEVGLVAADPAALVGSLEREQGLRLWSGSAEDGLAFVGEQARTLLVVPEGRGWLPTWQPAGTHPVEVELQRGGDPIRVVLP